MKVIAKNRRARHDYSIEDKLIAGMALEGSEVKSIRQSHVSLTGSFCTFVNGELYLRAATISPYKSANVNHDSMRDRKLLVTKKQLQNLRAANQQGQSIIPLAIGLERSFIKLEIGIGKGRKKYDKRSKIREMDDQKHIKKAG